MKHNPTMIDLFCGTGGFSYGFTTCQTPFDLVYGLDIDPFATDTAKANHPEALIETEDILKVQPKEVAKRIGFNEIDVLIGGPPCQGFSSLRPFRSSSIEDKRNNLHAIFSEFVNFFRPKVVVMENVVGLITYKQGQTLDLIMSGFESNGYKADWRILNAATYGIPQKRERLIIIASRDNSPFEFPSPTHYFDGNVIGHRNKKRHIDVDPNLPRAITVNEAIGDLPPLERGEIAHEYDREPITDYQKERRKKSIKLTLHKATNHSDKMLEIIKHSGENINCIPKHLISSGFSSCYSRLNGNKPSTTITVKFGSPASSKCIHPTQNRSITPREAARIQSFDDSFIFKGSLTRISSQIGNAVPPLLGRAIAGTVVKLL